MRERFSLDDNRPCLCGSGKLYKDCCKKKINITDEKIFKKYMSEFDKAHNSLVLSILVDTFSSRISLTMPPSPKPHNTACVLS